MDGTPLDLGVSPGATPCGVWVDTPLSRQIDLASTAVVDPGTHD
jgi:hypothetical protein